MSRDVALRGEKGFARTLSVAEPLPHFINVPVFEPIRFDNLTRPTGHPKVRVFRLVEDAAGYCRDRDVWLPLYVEEPS